VQDDAAGSSRALPVLARSYNLTLFPLAASALACVTFRYSSVSAGRSMHSWHQSKCLCNPDGLGSLGHAAEEMPFQFVISHVFHVQLPQVLGKRIVLSRNPTGRQARP
jgi:hypothetical protein